MNKILGVTLVVLALVMAVVPQFTDCQSQGRSLTLANGNTVAMKCHWTARGEIAVAAPLLVVGVMLAASRRKESQRNLSILGVGLGALAMLLPTYIIGVCANPMMVCNAVMQPTLLGIGGLAAAISLVGLVMAQRKKETVEP